MPIDFVMTVDLDPPPPSTPNLDISSGAMKLLTLFDQHRLKATFFVPANVASSFPEIAREVVKRGHEIACHGLRHDANEATLTVEEENRMIRAATEEIEAVTGSRPVGFRAPLFRLQRSCWIALYKNDYVYDSSLVCSLLHGNHRSLLSKPFLLSRSNCHAECNLLEIPVSVNPFLPFPLGGAYLRIFGSRWAKVGIRTNSIFNAPTVVYIHPKDVIYRTAGHSWYSYRNTANCMQTLKDIILYGKRIGAKFVKACELAELYLGKGKNV